MLSSYQSVSMRALILLILISAGGALFTVQAQTSAPILVSEPASTRAIAVDAVTFMPGPFTTASNSLLISDHRTRVMLFAVSFPVQPGEPLYFLTADAEDAAHHHYSLQVEYFGPVPGQPWLTAIVLYLGNDFADVGDVLVRVSHLGAVSNRVRLAISHQGGGPPDDPGSGPTPAPPYFISGKVTASGVGFEGATLQLSGAQTGTFVTTPDGTYQFTAGVAGGDYTITPSMAFHEFSPASRTFNHLSNHQASVDFVATRQAFTIAGQVLDDTGQPMAGLSIGLMSEAGTNLGTTVTASDGSYAFASLPAGYKYTVTPVSNSFFNFTGQSTELLGTDVTVNFNGVRRTYTISGSITEEFNGLAGVTVALNGSQAVATTNSSGEYSFANLPAGRNYIVVPSKAHHFFTPVSQSINNLGGDQAINFTSIHRYIISGHVTVSSGQALPGIKLTINGSVSETTRSAVDGSYAFMVPPGSYTLTPSIEQDWYSFSPAGLILNNITDDHTINFTATPAATADPEYVLELDGSPKAIFHGYYWDPGVDLGHFFWEFWAMPGPNAGATYLLADGYGGGHALLFGFANLNTSEPNRYQLFGDIFDGVSVANYFNSDQGPAPGEWGHFAVGWDGANIITYFNGVPVGKSPFAGPRRTPGVGGGGSWLFIGGSDHNNFQGRIAQARGYEVYNPREDPTGVDKSLVEASFAPETVFQQGGNLLSKFFRPADPVADLSDGYPTTFHPGILRGMQNGFFDPCSGCPLPEFVVDPTAPQFANNAPPVQVGVATPSTVPAGARVFDSFSRANSTYMFNGTGGLGATEGGSDGSRTWQTSQGPSHPQSFGILNGRGVMLANNSAVTWVTTNSATANLETHVERRPGINGSGLDTGISFRVLDDRNFFFAYTSVGAGDGSPRKLTVGYYLNGQRSNLASGITLPASWTTLRVVTKNTGALSIYAGGSLLFTTTNGNLANAAGCGLYNNSAGLGLVNRWDNFTVFDAP